MTGTKDNFIMLPTVDICFKNLMENPEERRGFIAALLKVRPEKIRKTSILPTTLKRTYANEKMGILDVLVVLEDGTQMDIEMQVAYFTYWDARALFYLGKIFTGQLGKGDSYEKLKKCIHVSILDFIRFADDDICYRTISFCDEKTGKKYTDLMEIQILELKKLPEKAEKEEALISWMRFLGGKTREEFEDMAKENEYIGIAYEELQKLSADELKRLDYESREKALKDYNTQMGSALKQGFRQGIAAGEKKKLAEITQRMYAEGRTPEEIAELLGEMPETIREIIRETETK